MNYLIWSVVIVFLLLITLIIVLFINILRRKRAEEALRESEEKYRMLFEHLPIPVFTKNRKGEYTSSNAENQRYWTVNPIGQTDAELLDHETAVALREADLRVMETGDTLTIEEHLTNTPLGERYVLSRKVPLRDGSGHIVGILGASLDITDRKRLEEALKIKDHAIASSLNGFAIADLAGNLTYVNHSWLQMNGYDDEKEVLGRRSEEFFFAKENVRAIMEGLPDKGGWEGELVAKRRDGSSLDLYLTASIVTDEDGKPICIMASGIDITERKQAEEELGKYRDHLEELVKERTTALQQEIEERKRTEVELQHAKEAALDALREAEAANKLKSEFLANMSHDIRTPLNAVIGFTEVLKEQLRGFPQYHRYLSGIMEGGHTLLHLINDILDLSRIEAGRLEIRSEAVNLASILNEVQYMFSSKAKKKGIQLESHISLDTPDTVLLDGDRLRQILVNLVGNAVKFTAKGSVTLDCRLLIDDWRLKGSTQQSTINNQQSTILFEVRDTGIGIPQDEQVRIFEPFQQHDPRSPGGTGLGLAITKRLIELMQGSITVESAVNEGTLFRVLLPATRIATPEEEGTARKPGEQIQFHGATVLLVEDNAPNREVVRAYTAACNLRLIEAENGQEALQMLKPESAGTLPAPRPDLILMDIRMPVMDGYEATQVIKADPTLQTIPVVALTAYAVKEQVEQYQDLYDAYLSKPISKLELIATLAEFLPHTKTSLERITHPSPSQEGNKRGMLEELKDYAAHTGTFPQALLDKLQVELLPRHQETCELMSADEMIEFAEAIIAVGDAFMIPPLKKYGEELLRYTKVSDVINMKRLLARFPEIVKIISK